MKRRLTRRRLIKTAATGTLSMAGSLLTPAMQPAPPEAPRTAYVCTLGAPAPPPDGPDPLARLTQFDYGRVSRLPDGRRLREFTLIADKLELEVAAGVNFIAWAYNGSVPGPTLRATEGDLVRVTFVNRAGHAHSIHFHGAHPARMDGVEPVPRGGQFTYEFVAKPFGLHLYHCHIAPLARHLQKGLYGAFIVDPPAPRPPAKELVMVLNGYDVNGDSQNEVYTINGIAHAYRDRPIPLRVHELVHIYLLNMTEFDPVSSLHLHAAMFKLYRTGTRLDHYDYTDIVTLGQAERAVLEFSYEEPGKYMFHPHQSRFAELGCMGWFDVVP